jgi:sec-independent protein translocase protein TatA
MFGRFGWMEILIIVVLLFILFGHSKIPTMMKNLANGINVFKKEMKKGDDKKPAAKQGEKVPTKPAPKKVAKPRAKKAAKK